MGGADQPPSEQQVGHIARIAGTVGNAVHGRDAVGIDVPSLPQGPVVVQVVPAIGNVVQEAPPGLEIGLGEDHVAQQASAFALAGLGAHPQQVPAARVLLVRAVLDVIPLGPQLAQQHLVNLAVVTDRVQMAAGFGDVQEPQIQVIAEPAVVVVEVGIEAAVPQARLKRRRARGGNEHDLAIRALGDGHQARALYGRGALGRRRSLAKLALRLAAHVIVRSGQDTDLTVARGLDHHRGVELHGPERGQVLDDHARDASILPQDRRARIVPLEDAHPRAFQVLLHGGLKAPRDVVGHRPLGDLSKALCPGGVLLDLVNQAGLGPVGVVAVCAGDAHAQVGA